MNYFLFVIDNKIKFNKGNMLLQVNLVVDYGVQGVDYNLDVDSDYIMGFVVMSWNLFD